MSRRNHRHFIRFMVGVMFALAALSGDGSALAQSGASFQGLGDLPGGAIFSEAWGVSADGSTAVGVSDSTASSVPGAQNREAFRWTQATGMVGLGDLPGSIFFSEAWNVSADGSVVVGDSKSTNSGEVGFEAFRWTQATGMVGLGDFPGATFRSRSFDVSADGSVVVGDTNGGAQQAFRWTDLNGNGEVDPDEKLQDHFEFGLGDFPAGSSRSVAFGVSADGLVVVGFGTVGTFQDQETFRWTQATGLVGLGDLPGGIFQSRAFGLSADALVLVGFGNSVSGKEASRWTEGTGMVGLGDLPGLTFDSEAWDVSADGSVVVGRGVSTSGDEAFIWDAVNGMRSVRAVLITEFALDLTGWRLTEARGVSDSGRVIVGLGVNPSGDTEGWIAVLGECTSDAECDDQLFCNGSEVCVNNACTSGGNPCQQGQSCDEENDTCVPAAIPAVSAWGLSVMLLLLLAGAKVYFNRRRLALV